LTERPIGIIIVAIIMFFAAVMAFIVGISTLVPGTALDVLWTLNNSIPADFRFTSMGMIFGYFLVIIGLVTLSSGIGLLKGLKWAWWVVVTIFALNTVGDVVKLVLGGIEGIAGILIAAGFLFYLTRPKVKNFFERPEN
jgi:hypothetical protein